MVFTVVEKRLTKEVRGGTRERTRWWASEIKNRQEVQE